jgi:hypothetical protein
MLFLQFKIRFYSRIDFYNRDDEKINECIDFEEQPIVDKKSQFSGFEYDAFVELLFETISDRICDLAFRYFDHHRRINVLSFGRHIFQDQSDSISTVEI